MYLSLWQFSRTTLQFLFYGGEARTRCMGNTVSITTRVRRSPILPPPPFFFRSSFALIVMTPESRSLLSNLSLFGFSFRSLLYEYTHEQKFSPKKKKTKKCCHWALLTPRQRPMGESVRFYVWPLGRDRR